MNNKDHIDYHLNDKTGVDKNIGIVKALWNNHITTKLYSSCHKTLIKYGVNTQNIYTLEVPGSFELIYGGKQIMKNTKLDAVILIGSIIKGETPHFDFISQAIANGVKDLNIMFDIPFIFCVSTDLNQQQALERAGGTIGNKGEDAANTALHLVKNTIN
mgnify:CR=1 FL=1